MLSKSANVSSKSGGESPLPPRRYYAVRVGGNVEVRSLRKPLKKIVSSIKRVSPEGAPYTLTQTYYDGGKVWAVWGYNDFYYLANKFGATCPPLEGYIPISNKVFIKEATSGPRK